MQYSPGVEVPVQIDSLIVNNRKIGQDRRVDTAIGMSVMKIAHIMATANQEQEGDAIIILTT